MNISRNVLSLTIAAAGAATLCGCSDEAVDVSDRLSNDYLKSFIEEFGVPVDGHDFSMARQAGLTVSTSSATHIIVTAVIEDKEYLFADLTVPAGKTPVAATIPSDVRYLNVHVGPVMYRVEADSMLDLDNPPAEEPQSRNVNISRPLSGGAMTYTVDDKGNPYLVFKVKDFLSDYLSANPLDHDNYKAGYQYHQGHPFLYCETGIGMDNDYRYSAEYDVFPIFWRRNKQGYKDYKVQLQYNIKFPDPFRLDYGDNKGNDNIPFPNLGFSSTITEYDQVNAETLLTDFVYDDGSRDQAFPLDDEELMVVSQGHKLYFPSWTYPTGVNIEVTYDHHGLGTADETFTLSSSGPWFNSMAWDGNYYHTTLDYLCDANGSTKRTFQNISLLYNEYSPDTNSITQEGSVYPFILGFDSAPSRPDDDAIRDYGNVIFLVIPHRQLALRQIYGDDYESYYWTIAAEDLGGSFDWDFNDVVFRFTDVVKSLVSENYDFSSTRWMGPTDATSVRVIEVEPLAAGGTLPVYITYTGKLSTVPEIPSSGSESYAEVNARIADHLQDTPLHDGTFIIGTELHDWLGASTYTRQLNTGETRDVTPGKKISFAIPSDSRPWTERFKFNSAMSSDNQPLLGFAILVDKDNDLNGMDISDDGFTPLPAYNLGQGSYLIGSPDENLEHTAPQMILISGGNWDWPQECVNIRDAYPDFYRWITEDTSLKWYNTKDETKVTQK